jgi:predicted enzyme related to lactoylglutathione lyase
VSTTFALEVGNIDEALRFYDKVFSFELRGTHRDDSGDKDMAFIDMGDQFLALSRDRSRPPDTSRHFDALGVSPEKSDEARAQMAAKGFL